ncbi:hypothetical protein [Halovivax sp.]|uniref:hypothetical protein n=1 Tax=Halovivax sp. TaxID=1935978 RepID=UPI0025BA5FEC|nr:hypothetical protein [Halovivax sp.]
MSDAGDGRSRFGGAGVVLAAVLILTPSILAVGALVGRAHGLGGTLAAAVLVLGALAAATLRNGGDGAEDGESATVWDAIPRWQYGGRHVESGGTSRDEQERALEEVEAQAETIERLDVENADEPPGGR